MVTIKDIARQANVSSATVSYVLNNTRCISPETRERVLQAVKDLDYVPNASARSLREKRSKIIGLIVSDISNPFYPDLAKACEDAAYGEGYDVMIFNTNNQKEHMQQAILRLRQERVDGILIVSAMEHDQSMIQELTGQGYPLVLVHRKPQGLDADSIVADQFLAVRLAMEHLTELGHRRIAFLEGTEGSPVNKERREAYKLLVKEMGLESRESWILDGDGSCRSGYDAIAGMLAYMPENQRPTAILSANDMAALGMLDAAFDRGLGIPEDLSVIGFDDLFVAGNRRVQLTTVHMPRYTMGRMATDILIRKINKKMPEKVEQVLPVKLMVRRTTGPVPG